LVPIPSANEATPLPAIEVNTAITPHIHTDTPFFKLVLGRSLLRLAETQQSHMNRGHTSIRGHFSHAIIARIATKDHSIGTRGQTVGTLERGLGSQPIRK
jgi:hypothetical protein